MDEHEEHDSRIPITLLTGFLGARKTTLLNHLLRQPEMARAAVLINEFGAVGIDHHLVERIDGNVVVLDSGCLCCTVKSELTRSLADLFLRALRKEVPVFDRVVIDRRHQHAASRSRAARAGCATVRSNGCAAE